MVQLSNSRCGELFGVHAPPMRFCFGGLPDLESTGFYSCTRRAGGTSHGDSGVSWPAGVARVPDNLRRCRIISARLPAPSSNTFVRHGRSAPHAEMRAFKSNIEQSKLGICMLAHAPCLYLAVAGAFVLKEPQSRPRERHIQSTIKGKSQAWRQKTPGRWAR